MSNREVKEFSAEIGKVLQLMIHSLYTNKDIFLRELISNASDACDKLRYMAVSNNSLIQDDHQFNITVKIDQKNRILTVTDNGVGMNRAELEENLGTIAKSGTQNFLTQLTGDKNKDLQLIGQFGVGFYSAFMVADEVKVVSKKAGEQKSYLWQSSGTGEYILEDYDGDHQIGTSIEMMMKEGLDDYLDKHRLKHIITTYSDHINIAIELIDEEGEAEIVNSSSALWARPKSEIKDEEYKQFYKNISYLPGDPWMVMHNKAEGMVEYTSLLFVPSMKPFDLFHPDRKTQVKLYVKRVFITEDNVQLVPAYLRFIRGIVDSEDLPLNISRETLQHNAMIDKIKKSITKKVIAELKKKADESAAEYRKFWDNFGAVLKEGLCEALDNKEQILEICRFFTSKSGEDIVSLDKYIESMKEDQEFIYFAIGDSRESLMNNPQVEGFIKQDIEVIFLIDQVDAFWVNVNPEYKEKEMKSVTRAGINIENPSEEKNDKIENLINHIKKSLGDQVKDVVISGKLADSPVCLTTPEGTMDSRMEKFLMEQQQIKFAAAKIFEINPKHKVIINLAEKLSSQGENAEIENAVRLLFDQARIIEGENIADIGSFAKRVNMFLEKALVA